MADTKINVMGLVSLIGSILMIIGVFLAWTSGTVDYLIGKETIEFSGWDIAMPDEGDKVLTALSENLQYSFAPLAVLVMGVLCLVFNVIPIFKTSNFGKIFAVLTLLMSIVVIILSVLFYTDVTGDITIAGFKALEVSAGTGLWLSLAGGIVVVLGGILNLVKKTA